MQIAYSTAAIPEPFRILGLRLRPFSLGHYLLLQRFDCSFISSEQAQLARADLLLAVLICSFHHADFLRFIEQKDFLKLVKKWGKRVGLFDVQEKTILLNQYLRASLTEPDYVELQPGGSQGDWAQNLKMTLITRLGYSESEALDMPLSKALADYYKLAESEGIIRLLTDEDLQSMRANTSALKALAGGERWQG